MAKIKFGDVVEEVVMRDEFPLKKAQTVLKNELVAVLGYGVQGPAQARGPLWEAITATNYLQAGADLVVDLRVRQNVELGRLCGREIQVVRIGKLHAVGGRTARQEIEKLVGPHGAARRRDLLHLLRDLLAVFPGIGIAILKDGFSQAQRHQHDQKQRRSEGALAEAEPRRSYV